MRSRLLNVGFALTLIGSVITGAGAAQASTPLPTPENPGGVEAATSPGGIPSTRQGAELHTFIAAKAAAGITPGMWPRGANDFSCKPKKGQNPIVLIPGTIEDAFSAWSFYSPHLRNAGYCVYTFNYNPSTNPTNDSTSFAGDIRQSAAFMAGFVDRVLKATGAKKVDLIGHSQGGGPLPRAYIKWYGGASKVNHLIGLVPSNHGTTMWGLKNLIRDVLKEAPSLKEEIIDKHNRTSLLQQLEGSPFLKELNEGGLTVPGVKYTVITTKLDLVVTPYTNAIIDEPGVKNEVVQNVCGLDAHGHQNFTYDPVAYQMVVNALNPAEAKPVNCWWIPPYLPAPKDPAPAPAPAS